MNYVFETKNELCTECQTQLIEVSKVTNREPVKTYFVKRDRGMNDESKKNSYLSS